MAKSKIAQNGTEVWRKVMTNARIKKKKEMEKEISMHVSKASVRVWPTVMQRGSQKGKLGEGPPCLNPTDRSSCLTGNDNQ